MRRMLWALSLCLPLCWSGCADPDVGAAPFLCNPGTPKCPDGLSCVKFGIDEVCYDMTRDPLPCLNSPQMARCPDGYTCQEGNPDICVADGGQQDAGVPDGGPALDQTLPPIDAPPAPKSVVVSEMMIDPFRATDGNGEYLELFNVTDRPIDVNGWTIRDNGSDSHRINAVGGLVIPSPGFLILGRSTDTAVNGGVPVRYAYTGFSLSNTDDEVVLLDAQGNTIFQVSYSTAAGWTITEGASLSLTNPLVDNPSDPAVWCTETATIGTVGDKDKGTPGAGPSCI